MRKNIVFILTDDQGVWSLGSYGNPYSKTPVLDKMAEEGVRYENFFCASPVCSPARASLLTGDIPSAHGVCDWLANGSLDASKFTVSKNNPYYNGETKETEYLANRMTYTDLLAKNGYTCSLVGKWHLGASAQPQHGFSRWITTPLGFSRYTDADIFIDGELQKSNGYITDVLTDYAIQELNILSKQYKNDSKNFYLSLHYTAPHAPWGKNAHPARIHDLYEGEQFQQIPFESMHPHAITGCESPYLAYSAQAQEPNATRNELLAGYLGSIASIDENIGRLLDEVRRLGIADDTIFFFSSDNGMNCGHHGIWGKGNGTYPQNVYDTSVKVPFIAYSPGNIGSHCVCKNLYSHYDFMPTLIDMLELELSEDEAAVISKLPGRSFLPSLYGNESNDQRPVIIFSEYGPTRMIRTRSFKYVQVQDHGEDLFFDLEKDPREQNNLISSPSYATTIKEMQKQLDSWFAEYADSCYDKFRLLSQGRGQVDTYESNSTNPFIQDESNGRNYLEVANQKREDMLRMIRDRQGNTR